MIFVSFQLGFCDCSNSSDEQGIFIINKLSSHNKVIVNLNKKKRTCRDLNEIQPLWKLCDYRTEYPCLRNVENLNDLWNFTLYKLCIQLSQIGDGIIQCYGARDEKNTIKIPRSAFLCQKNNSTIPSETMCRNRIRWDYSEDLHGCLMHMTPAAALTNNTLCDYDPSDVFCLNGKCKRRVCCDYQLDCYYGEDEYMCYLEGLEIITLHQKLHYRLFRQSDTQNTPRTLQLVDFPSPSEFKTENPTRTFKIITQENSSAYKFKVRSVNKFEIISNCNRGVAIHALENNNLSCFCPPSYYGEYCEYFSDHLTIVTHLNYTNSRHLNTNNDSIVLHVLTLLLFGNEIIDQYSFRVRPVDEIDPYMKHKFFLLYSRSEKYLNHKQRRYFNRTDIIDNQPYLVRFEVYELMLSQTIQFIGLWQFHIYFDYLPSFRFAKILRFPVNSSMNNPCQSNPCNERSICQRILNENSTSAYICLCQSPFYGKVCEFIDENCSKFCASHSVFAR